MNGIACNPAASPRTLMEQQGPKHQGTAQGCTWTNRGNHNNLCPERHSERLSVPQGLAWELGAWASAHTRAHTMLPVSTEWNVPLDGMCCEEPPVSTARQMALAWEKPSSVSTAIKIPSAATLGRAGDTPREEVARVRTE